MKNIDTLTINYFYSKMKNVHFHYKKQLLIVWLIMISSACSITTKQIALHDFGRFTRTQGKMSIDVNAPSWLWDNRIRYRLLYATPSEIKFYGLDRWIAAPPELFEQLLAFKGKAQDCIVRLYLQDFEQQFDAPDRSRVILHFSVEAYAVKDKLDTQEFYLETVTKTPDAAGAISGFTDLVQQANEKIQPWLMEIVNRERLHPLPRL